MTEWAAFARLRSSVIILRCVVVFVGVVWVIDSVARQAQNPFNPAMFVLLAFIALAQKLDRVDLIPPALVVLVTVVDLGYPAAAIIYGPALYTELVNNIVFYVASVAMANVVLFKPRFALGLNLVLAVFLIYAGYRALDTDQPSILYYDVVSRVFAVVGFHTWFSFAAFLSINRYQDNRRELVEVHHLLAEMERNQHLNEENARIHADLVRAQRVQMVDSMTSTMAHEVNQPISCANNYVLAARRWLARAEPDLPEALAALDGAQSEIERVSQRVMSVRRLMQRLSSEYTAIALPRVIDQAREIVGHDLAAQKIALAVTQADPGDDYGIYGCEEELLQVLINLIANAADALRGRAEPRTITLSLADADLGELALVVADSGPGIPADQLARVFDRLYSTKQGGSGLGLPLCQRIVTDHGGTIAIDSVVGQGTRVTIRLPRAAVEGSGWGA